MKFDILTLFPEMFDSYFNESIIKRARQKKIIEIVFHNFRQYAKDKHNTVDDKPYGGGPGMILMVEPIDKALRAVKKKKKRRVIMMSPAGKRFTQRDAERLAKYEQLILLCGRYEGFDCRIDDLVDEKISIGDFVLAGGELPAMIIVEAVSRQIPGVLGNKDATAEETFSGDLEYVEYPQYTRPESYKVKYQKSKVKNLRVPKVLLSGNHAEIRKWRNEQIKKVR